jgi:hypothetical protein
MPHRDDLEAAHARIERRLGIEDRQVEGEVARRG